MSLGSQISFYRKKAGITQAQLADAMGVSFQAVMWVVLNLAKSVMERFFSVSMFANQ